MAGANHRNVVDESTRRSRDGVLHRVAMLAIAAPRRTIAVATLILVAAGVFGIPVAKSLSAGGFADPTSESAKATTILIDKFGQGDVQLVEAIAIPLSFIVLVWVFGGLFAAALPVAIGGMSILGSLAVLRLVAFTTDVSIFALNLTTALGLALAIDYTLLIVSRFRDEMAGGATRDDALVHTMVTAGRTVLFSATTVALSMAAMS